MLVLLFDCRRYRQSREDEHGYLLFVVLEDDLYGMRDSAVVHELKINGVEEYDLHPVERPTNTSACGIRQERSHQARSPI